VTGQVRSAEARKSFVAYLAEHPDERLWQALRNWSGYPFIYASEYSFDVPGSVDTFHWEGRNS